MAEGKENENFEDNKNGEDVELPDLAKEIQDDINRQVQMHFSRLENDVRDVFSQRMASIETNLSSQISERVLSAQSNILKTNKVFRDICRPLGPRWRELFLVLTEGIEAERVEAEVAAVENQTPMMQPYKSLMSWKELKGKSFDLEDLVAALRRIGMEELAQKVHSVLHGDSTEELFDLSSFGKCLASESGPASSSSSSSSRAGRSSVPISRTRTTSGGSPGAAATAPSFPRDEASARPTPPKDATLEASGFTPPSAAPVPEESNSGIIDDRRILLLAKQVADVWDKLARALRVPQSDVSDILTSEGSLNYQGAFRMLWIWRESRSDQPEQCLELLAAALQKIGRPDLVATLRS